MARERYMRLGRFATHAYRRERPRPERVGAPRRVLRLFVCVHGWQIWRWSESQIDRWSDRSCL